MNAPPPDSSLKVCRTCKLPFPATNEYFDLNSNTRGGLSTQCKQCRSDRMKAYKAKRREVDAYYEQTPDAPVRTIECAICGLVCKTQVTSSHLRVAHGLTTKEYRALGYETLSPARLAQLLESAVSRQEVTRHYGADHHNFKGGHVTGAGYRVVSRQGHTNLYEHRLVAEAKIGRKLNADEVVHHIDGNRANNHPDNLQVMTGEEHTRQHKVSKRRFHIAPETEEAAFALRQLGWSIGRISRALRVDYKTIASWLANS